MGLGVLLLLGWAAVTGHAGQLAVLDAEQWTWALVTGAPLVATWNAALARASAVDITAVLVFGAVTTAPPWSPAGRQGRRRR
jgi:hypothetical protein